MEVYLNVAETGPGIYGAEAAARRYFGKPAERAHPARGGADRGRPAQPARLVAARGRPATSAQRARTIERRMGQLGPLLDCVR